MNLTGITWDHPRGYDPFVAVSDRYHLDRGIHVSWDKRSLEAFADASIKELAQTYDLLVLDHPHVAQVAQCKALLPLPKPEDDCASIGESAESYVWDGHCWAYAIDAASQMAAHRPGLNSPLSRHWEDFQLQDSLDIHPLTPLLPVDAFDMFLSIVAGRGGEDIPYKDNQFVSEANGIYALEILRALHRLGPSEQISMNPIHVLEALSSSYEFACLPCLFGYVNYARPGFREHCVTYFDLPLCKGSTRPRAILGGAGIGVSADTSHPDAALDFVSWVASHEVQSGIYLDNNGQPANRHTWLENQTKPEVAGVFAGGFHTMDNAWTRPRDVWFMEFVDDVCEELPNYFKRAIPATDILAQINTMFKHNYKGN